LQALYSFAGGTARHPAIQGDASNDLCTTGMPPHVVMKTLLNSSSHSNFRNQKHPGVSVMKFNQSSTFSGWLGEMPEAWRDAFTRGRIETRETLAKESSNLDEVARHVIAARDIGAGIA
jgi:hypothetical protein